MSSRDSSPEITRRVKKLRSPIKGVDPTDDGWQVAGSRRRSPRSSSEADSPTRSPVPESSRSPPLSPLNLESDQDFPRLLVSTSGSSSPIDNPYAQTVKAAVKRR